MSTKWLDALEMILDSVEPMAPKCVPLADALDFIAACDVIAPENLPPFDNSAMDGFAVRYKDCAGASMDNPIRLSILEDLPAGGLATHALSPRTAIRIMTGAAIPTGCDAVVPVENTRMAKEPIVEGYSKENVASPTIIEILRVPKHSGNIRFAGEDVAVGQTVIAKGTKIGPSHVGLLAALGVAEISVIPPVKVAIITTGSELVDVASKPDPGKIRDSNLHSLGALLQTWGAIPLPYPRIGDTRPEVESALLESVTKCDVVLTTGGISVGDFDHVKDVLVALGAKQHFWRVAQKPGGPMGYWTLKGKPFFGLPGNPVSAFVMAELYLKPTLNKMMGRKYSFQFPVSSFQMEAVAPGGNECCKNMYHHAIKATLETGFRKSGIDGKRHFLRVIATEKNGIWTARLSGPQGSAQLSSLCAANALAMIPEDVVEVPDGGEVEVVFLGS